MPYSNECEFYINPSSMDAFPDYATSNLEFVINGWFFPYIGAAVDYLRRAIGFEHNDAIAYLQLLVDDIPKHPWL
jgi:hypothetical protein